MKDKAVSERTGRSPVANILYIAAAVVALVGIALLIDNIYIYKSTIEQYVAQGYPAAEVKKSIIPAQLLPGIFDPVGVYGGVALILIGIGASNKKLSKLLAAQAGAGDNNGPEEGSGDPEQIENAAEQIEGTARQTESAAGQTVGQDKADAEGLELAEPADKDLP